MKPGDPAIERRQCEVRDTVPVEIGNHGEADVLEPGTRIGRVRQRANFDELAFSHRPYAQASEHMRHLHVGDIEDAITVEVCNARRIDPCVLTAGWKRLGHDLQAIVDVTDDRKGSAFSDLRSNQNDLVVTITVEVDNPLLCFSNTEVSGSVSFTVRLSAVRTTTLAAS